MIQFIVPAIPVAQPRQRHRLVAIGGKQVIGNYTPSKHPVVAFKAACWLAAQAAYQGPPLTGPLAVRLVFVLPRPASAPKRQTGRMPHLKKPDADNLAKSVCDALSGLLFHDDRQVWNLTVEKWIASATEPPHVEVQIFDLDR